MPHARCLRIIYNETQLPFTELLNKDSSVSIHTRNIQRLVIETFSFYKGLSISLMSNIFKLGQKIPTTSYVSEFSRSMVKSVFHGTGSNSYLALEKLKDIEKRDLKSLKPDN